MGVPANAAEDGVMMLAVAPEMMAAILAQPMRVPSDVGSLLWALPICLSIALIYKAIKLETFRPILFVREVALLFATIVCFLIVVAVVLVGVTFAAGV